MGPFPGMPVGAGSGACVVTSAWRGGSCRSARAGAGVGASRRSGTIMTECEPGTCGHRSQHLAQALAAGLARAVVLHGGVKKGEGRLGLVSTSPASGDAGRRAVTGALPLRGHRGPRLSSSTRCWARGGPAKAGGSTRSSTAWHWGSSLVLPRGGGRAPVWLPWASLWTHVVLHCV